MEKTLKKPQTSNNLNYTIRIQKFLKNLEKNKEEYIQEKRSLNLWLL